MPKKPSPTGKILLRIAPELHARLIAVSGCAGPAKLLGRYVETHLVPALEKKRAQTLSFEEGHRLGIHYGEGSAQNVFHGGAD